MITHVQRISGGHLSQVLFSYGLDYWHEYLKGKAHNNTSSLQRFFTNKIFLSYFSYGINWPNQNQPICKIRLFILMVCWSMATWSFVGASIDRYLCSSSSAANRLKSTARLARQYMTVMLIISIVLFLEIFYCYDASVPNVPVACYTHNLACQIYNDWVNILFDIIIPSGFMAFFGILTILNIRKRIIHPISTANTVVVTNPVNMQSSLKKIDHNLRKVLLIQVSLNFAW